MDICLMCKKEIVSLTGDGGTGYGMDKQGNKICYSCCAEVDRQTMRSQGKISLYLVKTEKKSPVSNGSPFWMPEITNWPGTLRIPVLDVRTGRHNLAGKRYDVHFIFEEKKWHGVTYGDNTQICHCKVLKS
jgi:hypothetical protein